MINCLSMDPNIHADIAKAVNKGWNYERSS